MRPPLPCSLVDDAEPPVDQAARVRAGAAIRRVGHVLVGGEHDVAALDELSEALEGLVERMEVAPPRSRPAVDLESWLAAPPPAEGEAMVSSSDRPVSGLASPWGLEPVVHRRGDWAVAEVTLRSAHEGAPERAHGGVVAAMFDDLYGFVIQIERVMAFTGQLTVRYAKPTPLHVPVVFRARLDRREGRRLHMEAEASAGEETFARSTALFIAVDSFSL